MRLPCPTCFILLQYVYQKPILGFLDEINAQRTSAATLSVYQSINEYGSSADASYEWYGHWVRQYL